MYSIATKNDVKGWAYFGIIGIRGLSLKVQRYYLGELIQYSYIGMNNGMVIESMNLSRYILKL